MARSSALGEHALPELPQRVGRFRRNRRVRDQLRRAIPKWDQRFFTHPAGLTVGERELAPAEKVRFDFGQRSGGERSDLLFAVEIGGDRTQLTRLPGYRRIGVACASPNLQTEHG